MPVDLPLDPGHQLTAGQDGGAIVRRSVLPGGVRVLTETMPGLRSATLGAWVGVGSRDERDGHHGATHFLEHLLFKGTGRRSALDIAEAFDAVGGEANAATGKEHTCYYARVLDADLPMAVDVIADMVTSARLDPGELEIERGVILEELAMNDDDPSDVAHEQFAAAVLGGHPLGRPIGGTPSTIRAVPRDAVWEHYREHYTRPRPGGHGRRRGRPRHALRAGDRRAGRRRLGPGRRRPCPRRGRTASEAWAPEAGTELVVRRATEQANVVVGGVGLTATDERRYALSVLGAVLGGGMSSRLFQEIRERRGLAYAVYSFSSGHADTGLFGLYAGCAPERVEEVERLMVEQAVRLAEEPITGAELDRSIGQLSGGLVLGMEDTGSRMNRLGKAELVQGELVSVSEALERIRCGDRGRGPGARCRAPRAPALDGPGRAVRVRRLG